MPTNAADFFSQFFLFNTFLQNSFDFSAGCQLAPEWRCGSRSVKKRKKKENGPIINPFFVCPSRLCGHNISD